MNWWSKQTGKHGKHEYRRSPSTISQTRTTLRLLNLVLVIVQHGNIATVKESAETIHHDQKDVPLLCALLKSLSEGCQ